MEAPDPHEPVNPAVQATSLFFKLADFWAASPVAWFGGVESQFRLRGVEAEEDKFSLVAVVLPELVARQVAHLLSAPPAERPFVCLKAALLSAHKLTDIQRAEGLFNMDNLGARRPMELLTEMLELVEPGEEKTKLFAMLFLQRLPQGDGGESGPLHGFIGPACGLFTCCGCWRVPGGFERRYFGCGSCWAAQLWQTLEKAQGQAAPGTQAGEQEEGGAS